MSQLCLYYASIMLARCLNLLCLYCVSSTVLDTIYVFTYYVSTVSLLVFHSSFTHPSKKTAVSLLLDTNLCYVYVYLYVSTMSLLYCVSSARY